MMYVDAQRTSLVSATVSQHRTFTRSCFVHPLTVYSFVLLILSGLLSPIVSQTSFFYPFGLEAGDNATAREDDGGSGKIILNQPFPFFGKTHERLYVNNNGVISFLKELGDYRPKNFPLEDGTPIIAPYWADVDVQIAGTVWYRQTFDSIILQRADRDVHTYSSLYRKFHANWAFIATWDQVGFYGALDEGKNKRNSFQCVLVSDGMQSFVIINYEQIEWTTGANSRGISETGLGGNPAQAGFNAGDRANYYEIEGAKTDSVINLTRTSNVGIPGRWIFRVDAPEIEGDSGDLLLLPSSGSMLGGYEVNITGPCFQSITSVQGRIVDTNDTFPCLKESDTQIVLCIMPTVFLVGSVKVAVLVDNHLCDYVGEFTFVNAALVDAEVIRHSPHEWRADRESVRISLEPSLFPSADQLIVGVMTFSMDLGGSPQLKLTGSEIKLQNNAKMMELQLPSLRNATLAVIRVKVPHKLINGSYLSHWSDVFPVRWKNSADSEEWCSDWLSQEKSHSKLTQQAACPCTLRQAESDTGRWQKDPLCSSNSPAQFNCIFRGSRLHECIVPTFRGSETINQHCCYDSNNELVDVREGTGGSIQERYHFRSYGNQVVPWFSYLIEDVAPFLHCCEYSSNKSLCDKFFLQRAPVSCQGYTPPAVAQAAGDPHIVTLDGVNYTFNGEGDFVLLQDTNERIRVHVHATRAVNIDNQLSNATLFTAVAMSVRNETDVVEIRTDPVAVLVNQLEVDFTSSQHELRGMTIYRNNTGNNTVDFTVVLDTAGISVLVSATEDLLNIMALVGASELQGNLTGLLGNYNGVKEDDFKSRYGSSIPITANMSTVHYDFGMTWFLPLNETLLYHPAAVLRGNSSGSYLDSHFVPIFLDTLSNEEFRNGTVELCQGNLQCIFDFQLTGKESIGESIKTFSSRFENVRKEIEPVTRCPYVENIEHGNRTLEGQAAGQKVYFHCENDFQINGTDILICLQSGAWNGSVPECTKIKQEPPAVLDVIYLGIGVGVGGFAFVIILALLVRYAVFKCHQKCVRKPDTDARSEPELPIELPTLFPPSEVPNPVFENDHFLASLQKLSEKGKFQIPRPRYVDPNIYTEYF